MLRDQKQRVRIVKMKKAALDRNASCKTRIKRVRELLKTYHPNVKCETMDDLLDNFVIIFSDPNVGHPRKMSIITRYTREKSDGTRVRVTGDSDEDFVDITSSSSRELRGKARTKFSKSRANGGSRDADDVRSNILRNAISRNDTIAAAHACEKNVQHASRRMLKLKAYDHMKQQSVDDLEVSKEIANIEAAIRTLGINEEERRAIAERTVLYFEGDQRFTTSGRTFILQEKLMQRMAEMTASAKAAKKDKRLWIFSLWSEHRVSKSCWQCEVTKRIESKVSDEDRSFLLRDMNMQQCISNRSLDRSSSKLHRMWDYVFCEKCKSVQKQRDYKSNRCTFQDLKSFWNTGSRAPFLETKTSDWYNEKDIKEIRSEFQLIDQKRQNRRIMSASIVYVQCKELKDKIALEFNNQCGTFDIYKGHEYLLAKNVCKFWFQSEKNTSVVKFVFQTGSEYVIVFELERVHPFCIQDTHSLV